MQVLDRTGVGTLWSICKAKFALKDHSHNYLPLSGGTLTGDLLFSNSGTTFRQIQGTCGDNDFWRIGGGATETNAGYMEIATADDGNEPIYVRQYSGVYSTITRTATLLDADGNTSFPGRVTASAFIGDLDGNASSANEAIGVVDYNDSNSAIRIGYAGAGLSSSEIGYIAGFKAGTRDIKDISKGVLQSWLGIDNTVKDISINTQGDTVNGFSQVFELEYANENIKILKIDNATTDINGFMSRQDKIKLDGIHYGANNYTLPEASENTLGGIKVTGNHTPGTEWPICVDNNGLANTIIFGLDKSNDGSVGSINLSGHIYNVSYIEDEIFVTDKLHAEVEDVSLNLPHKSGTFALLSDIPNVSNLCKFNFIDDISKCINGRINFLFKTNNTTLDLSFLCDLEEGTILFIYSNYTGYEVTCRRDTWYYKGAHKSAGETDYVNRGLLRLAFYIHSYVYLCSF